MDTPKADTKMREINTRDYKWECDNCRFLLGFISQDTSTLRIKYRDLYVTVQNGDVTITCRRCGKNNVLQQNREEVNRNGV